MEFCQCGGVQFVGRHSDRPMEDEPPLALGTTDVLRQCEEIKNSEVNQCPVEDLRMVLEEGASVALRAHQKNVSQGSGQMWKTALRPWSK